MPYSAHVNRVRDGHGREEIVE